MNNFFVLSFLSLLLLSKSEEKFELLENDFDILKNNLFESLSLDPKLNGEEKFSTDSANFIDRISEQFLSITSQSVEKPLFKSKKRSINGVESITRDPKGVKLFTGIKPYFIGLESYNSSRPIEELTLFENNNERYFTLLEKESKSYDLKILKTDENVKEVVKIEGVLNYTSYFTPFLSFFAIKSNDTSGVYKFQYGEMIQVQSLNFSNIINFKIWSSKDNQLFLFVLNKYENSNKVEIYKWLDSYFDPIDEIKTTASDLYLLNSGEKVILALLNIKASDKIFGEYSEEWTELYYHNIDNNKFELQQRIPTNDCKELKSFSFKSGLNEDSFLIITNSVEDDDEQYSILYRQLDDYFIPFQTLSTDFFVQWLPIETQDALLLMMMTDYEMVAYQFDGWFFRKAKLQPDVVLLEDEAKSIHFYEIKNIPLLVLNYKHGKKEPLVFQLEFTHRNYLENFQNEMLSWCQISLSRVRDSFRTEKNLVKRQALENPENTNEEENLKLQLTSLIESVENKMLNTLQTPRIHRLETLKFKNLTVTNHTFSHSLKTDSLNRDNANNILQQIVNINDDMHSNHSIWFETIQIDAPISPEFINGKEAKRLLHSSDNLKLKGMFIDKDVVFKNSLEVGSLNGEDFNTKNVIINNMDQDFSTFKVNTLKTEGCEVKKINNFVMENMTNLQGTPRVESLNTLKAKNIIIGGFLNDFDMRTLEKYALKTVGDQIITGKYYFNRLSVKDLDVNVLSRKKVKSNLLTTKPGEYFIPGNIQFVQNLTVNELNIKEFLDLIPVQDNKLDVLLKNSKEVQHITEKKVTQDVVLLNPLKLRGKIDSQELDKLKPVKTIRETITVRNDIMITGNTTIEEILKANNILTPDGLYSLKKLKDHGLKLENREVNPHLEFTQQLNVDEVFVDFVNGNNPQDWIVMGTPSPQKIHGWKVFTGDVNITGDTNILKINNIDVQELNNLVLRKNGDQIISAKHHFASIIADRINSNATKIGNIEWEHLLTFNTDQEVEGTTIVTKTITVNMSDVDNLNVKHNINDMNYTKILKNTVFLDKITKPIFGHKIIRNLTVTNLKLPNIKMYDTREIIYNNDVELKQANVENLLFTKSCNGIERKTFQKRIHDDEEIIPIYGDLNLENLIVLGDVFIDSNLINGVNITEIYEESIKTDEMTELRSVKFDEVMSEDNLMIRCDIEGIDFDNLVHSFHPKTQEILDRKIFTNGIFVANKSAILTGQVNQIDYGRMCNFTKIDPENSKSLQVNGNVIFLKQPNVHKLFDIPLQYILENAWFKNENITIDGNVNINNLIFRDIASVKGLVDGVNLKDLQNTYFSLTKDQNVSKAYFAYEAYFDSDIRAPFASMNGKINGINLNEFLKTALLQGCDQVFEDRVYFEQANFDDLKGDFTVNDYSVGSDLMRYDKLNLVTGHKTIDNLNIDIVQIKEGIKVQDVDMINWLSQALPKIGLLSSVKKKILHGRVDFLQGVTVRGLVNGINMTENSLMLKSVPQTITGKLQFLGTPLQPVSFRNLKIKGRINGIDMNELMQNQVYGNNDLQFESPINFHQYIETNNLNLMKPYQGIDINQLITNTTDLQIINELTNKYKKLLKITEEMADYLSDGAYYLSYYEKIQEISPDDYVTNLCCGKMNIIACSTIGNDFYMHFYEWNHNTNIFEKLDRALYLGPTPNYFKVLKLGHEEFLYMEHPHPGGPFKGELVALTPTNEPVFSGSLMTFEVKEINTFTIFEQNSSKDCLLIIYQTKESPAIICKNHTGFYLHQTLSNMGSSAATIAKLEENPLIIIASETENTNGNITIWSLQNGRFNLQQIMYMSDPRSVSSATFRNVNYLASVHGTALPSSFIDIRKYDPLTKVYVKWQNIKISKPKSVEFMILPSNEMYLLVTREDVGEPLIIYRLNGISGFVKHVIASNVGQVSEVEQFTMNNEHFIMLKNKNLIQILRANFKGTLRN